ncbi:hypothetical protein ALI144C_02365 [Actinosynnema sp. ALI-1.44]|uniref:putative quinol monooxygenase n=1 Tax=Actinosynnema sp. ALI-1.44 TaxID=1933779 RepID=UPI00097BAF1E|nr:antibiotic biosynthesis monooxygenase [Actinosynnema sp. ALI-1.44]ONI90818.1 hypothetical protein ALI144C_02365 [Actinosynnema sp. ALI-1.44]
MDGLMTSAHARSAGPDFFTFETLRVDRPETAGVLADILVGEVRDHARHTAGFVTGRVHLGVDGTTVVSCGQWGSAADHSNSTKAGPGRGALGSLANRPEVTAATTFGGTRAAGVDGPAAAEPPGFVAVATRHVAGHESASAMVDLLVQSGEWKRDFPGFISATPYISLDGKTFVNYPQWVNEAAFHRYMAAPRIAEGQAAVASLEVAPAEFVLCRVVMTIDSEVGG